MSAQKRTRLSGRNTAMACSAQPNIIFASTNTESNRLAIEATENNFPCYQSRRIDLDQRIRKQRSLKDLESLNGKIIHTQFPLLFLGDWEEFMPLLNNSIIVTTQDDLKAIRKSIECFLWESDEPFDKLNQRFESYWEKIRNSVILFSDLDNQRAYFRFMQSVAEKTGMRLPGKLKPLKTGSERIKGQFRKIASRISLS